MVARTVRFLGACLVISEVLRELFCPVYTNVTGEDLEQEIRKDMSILDQYQECVSLHGPQFCNQMDYGGY